MKIGLNGQKLLEELPAGPEKYTYNLFNALSKIDFENEYVIYFDRKPDETWFQTLVCGNKNFKYKVIHKFLFWTQLSLASELNRNPVDVFFSAVHTIPFLRNRKTKYVLMVHGLEYNTNKNYSDPIYRYRSEKPLKLAVINCDKIITPSNATKTQLLKQNWITDIGKVEVVYEGVNEIFIKPSEDVDVRSKYNLGNSPYILFLSTIQPRKNIPAMVEAFAKLVEENPRYGNIKLVLAGKYGWDYQESVDSPKKYGVEKNVCFIGRVPDCDQPSLYKKSIGYINVSKEEGFGLPLIEALACGIPCVVSKISAFEEIGKCYPIFVDPKDIKSIKEGIRYLLEARVTKEELLEGKKYAQTFSWEQTAKKTLLAFQNVVKNV